MNFTDSDYWRGIILYGLNAATYKIALGKTLIDLSQQGLNTVSWDQLSEQFLKEYLKRLSSDKTMPQQSNPNRWTVMERIVKNYQLDKLSFPEAIDEVGRKAFGDVIPRFQTIGTDTRVVKDMFYEFYPGQKLILTDELHRIVEREKDSLLSELDARWSLLEGAFSLKRGQFELQNDILDIYLKNGHERTNLTGNIPFLKGYQGNTCFYCGESIQAGDVHVDHVLPRTILNHDEVWNLVLSHSTCNLNKEDFVVGPHYFEKLEMRNENIMGSNHPWKQKISASLGLTPSARKASLRRHYENVKTALNNNYWGGHPSYNPATDPFFKRLITVINNQ